MKRILTLTLIAIIASTAASKAQNNYSFISQQHQQVKYDTVNKAYFIDSEVNSVSKIRIQDNAVYFISTEGTAFEATKVNLTGNDLNALENKNSFTMTGKEDKNGNNVKVAFWFIDGVLDEVSYTDEASKVTIAYKDLVNKSEDTSAKKAVASTRPNKGSKMN
ncbi:MAG: hypothetical protein KF746_14085 [Chitinophagaceae bacterium]|nr:hypothetical protein [Chitinophagaceae bacterium]